MKHWYTDNEHSTNEHTDNEHSTYEHTDNEHSWSKSKKVTQHRSFYLCWINSIEISDKDVYRNYGKSYKKTFTFTVHST